MNSVDTQIDLQLQSITKIILENISHVRSILLAGGFGKGEGSIKIVKGRVTCLKDFDIVVIVNRIPDKKTQDRVHDQIYASLGIENPKNKLFPGISFQVDILYLRKRDLIYPDIKWCDLKFASKLLYGENVRSFIPWSEKDVPMSSGLRLLFEKACGLLGHFSPALLEPVNLSSQRKEALVFECYKTFVESGTALCILARKYQPKYASRAKSLEQFYSAEFPKLAKVLPDLAERVTEYTSFKLNPDFTRISKDPSELWFSARNCLEAVLRFYLKRYLDVLVSDWKDLPNQMKILARCYYKPFLDPFIRARLGFSNTAILDIAVFLYALLTNLEYAFVVTRDMGTVYLGPLHKSWASPSLKFFTSGILILFSLNEDGTIERECMKKAITELRECIPVDVSTFDLYGWNDLRKHFLKANSLYEGYHFVR